MRWFKWRSVALPATPVCVALACLAVCQHAVEGLEQVAVSSAPAVSGMSAAAFQIGKLDNASHANHTSGAKSLVAECSRSGDNCRPGILLPMWLPTGDGISAGDKAARAVVYFLGLCFLFLGVSIISDRFMSAIEVITSKEKVVVITKPLTGEVVKVSVRIWNETVSNLTLMALGSSAPEILLSIIEVIGNDFEAGDLGPGTIVGSAAYNLFIIIALCVYVLPDGVTKRIKHLRVFFITASMSVFAYVWLYIIIAVSSPGEVSVWEGVLTFIFFPLTVLTAYIADKKLLPHKMLLSKRYRTEKRRAGVIVQSEGKHDLELEADHEKAASNGEALLEANGTQDTDATGEEVALLEAHRQEYVAILRELRKKHPSTGKQKLQEMAQYEVINRGPKSRAFYRIMATRTLTGGGNVIRQKLVRERANGTLPVSIAADSTDVTKVFFEPANYTVMENVGSLELTVKRHGGNLNKTVRVDYKTEDATASAGSDYEATEGTLTFLPGETAKTISVAIIDDNFFEEDEHFSVVLSNPRSAEHASNTARDNAVLEGLELGASGVATVVILDDDHGGVFHFDEEEHETNESAGQVHIKVTRSSGARGRVWLPYKVIDGTAKNGRDYDATASGHVDFADDEYEKAIAVNIIDAEEYQKDASFCIELGEPRLVHSGSGNNADLHQQLQMVPRDPNDMTENDVMPETGKPRLGPCSRICIRIKESSEFKSTVDKLLNKSGSMNIIGTSSWKEQFLEAVTVSAGDGKDSDEDESTSSSKLPSCGDYVCHYVSLIWKLLFAFVPPTDYFGGWLCFVVSILVIGLLTAVIGDLANHFGCTIGLKDAVTAISFVALGTSLPDTFASKVAAVNDEYADSSIGNVTGSNAVNVFLGIGIAWSIAAIKHAINGTVFKVKAGSLAFAVTLFCVFAFLCITVLLIRRLPFVGGELGGPRKYKVATTCFMVLLWVLYILLSALECYCYIPGF